MKTLNSIGLDSNKSKLLADKMNLLLANYSIFYQNTRGYHWNIKGDKFFELHIKFEELYNDLLLKIDEVAERILTLGYTPNHRYSDYKSVSEIKESKMVSDGMKAVEDILSSFKSIITFQRELLSLSEDASDEGTNALMSDYIREQEKLVWMYSAFLNQQPFGNGVGLIRFDQDAYPVDHATCSGLSVTRFDTDADRFGPIGLVSAYGRTSVGDGVKMARVMLDALPAADFEEKAFIVFTDGHENEPVSISSV